MLAAGFFKVASIFAVKSFLSLGKDNKCDTETNLNSCVDPLHTYCNLATKKCICKDAFPIKTRDGFCFGYLDKIDEPCWISDQCTIKNTKCLRGATKYLDSVLVNMWTKFVESGGKKTNFIPGKCQCMKGFKYDLETNLCVPRNIGKPCRSNDGCSFMEFAVCYKRICQCDLHSYYDKETDTCKSMTMGMANVCEGKKCPNSYTTLLLKDAFAGMFGFIISMVFMALVWYCICCMCQRKTSKYNQREELRFSTLGQATENYGLPAGDRNQELNLSCIIDAAPKYDEPPTYEEAVDLKLINNQDLSDSEPEPDSVAQLDEALLEAEEEIGYNLLNRRVRNT